MDRVRNPGITREGGEGRVIEFPWKRDPYRNPKDPAQEPSKEPSRSPFRGLERSVRVLQGFQKGSFELKLL